MKRHIMEIQMAWMVALLLVVLGNIGCGNPSQKKLSKTLEQTNSLVILSVTDRCEPHFYPSSEFSWDRMWGGMSKGAVDGYEEIPDFFWEYEYYPMAIVGLLYSAVRVPVGAIGGGISEAHQMPHLMKCHFRYGLLDAFEGQNPCGRVAGRIQVNCAERIPEFNPYQVYWSDLEGADYRDISSSNKKAKIKGLCKSLGESGEMLLVIQGVDFGLTGGTMENQESCFFMIVQAELVRGKDGKQIYRREFEYESPPHRFNEWEGHGRTLLKEQYHWACLDLGDRISKEVLGVEKYSQ